MITDAKMVARHYLRTWFCVDALSALPINFFLGQETLGGANRVPRLIRIPRIIRLMRLIRLLRLLKLLQTTSVRERLQHAAVYLLHEFYQARFPLSLSEQLPAEKAANKL